jgi:hypothetical protein
MAFFLLFSFSFSSYPQAGRFSTKLNWNEMGETLLSETGLQLWMKMITRYPLGRNGSIIQ